MTQPKLTRRDLLATSAITAGAVAAGTLPFAGEARAADKLKAAWVYTGPVGDFGYSYQHDVGRKAVAAKFPDTVETSFVEKVPEGPDTDRVLRQLASNGNQLIFATSFGFMDPVIRVAKQFPKVHFEHATGFKKAANVGIYNARFHEGRAVCGTIAAHTTKTGVIGYIGSFPIPEVVMGINAFTLAAQKIRPDIKVKLIWVNTWYDPGKEADAAKVLFDQGADIICQHTDSPAPLQVAQERGLAGFGQSSNMASFAPEAQLTSIVDLWDNYYIKTVEDQLAGTWKAGDVWWGLKEGLVEMSPYGPKVSPEAAAAADKVKAEIIAGTLNPFTGPITDQKGVMQVKAGETAPDGELLKMSWWVPGVEGQLGG